MENNTGIFINKDGEQYSVKVPSKYRFINLSERKGKIGIIGRENLNYKRSKFFPATKNKDLI